MSRHLQSHQTPLVGVHPIPLLQAHGGRSGALAAQPGDRGQNLCPRLLGQTRRSPRMIAMPMGKENPGHSRIGDGTRKSPDVAFHIRARVDDDYLFSADEKGPGAIESEGSFIPGPYDSRFQNAGPQRRSAASCSASLSATWMMAASSSGVNAFGSMESMSISPKISSPARIRITSSDDIPGWSSM